MLCRFSRVVGPVQSVPMCDVSVVCSLLVISTLVVLGSFEMVFRCMPVMFSSLLVVICAFICRLAFLSNCSFAGRFYRFLF